MNNYFIIIAMLVFSAFFSGLEIAFVSANKLLIELDKGKGVFSARIISGFVHHPSRFIGAMLVGNNIALVIYGIAFAAVLDPFLLAVLPTSMHSESVILILQTLISTFVILITAEFLPKILFRLNPNGLMSFFAIPAYISYLLLYPFMYLFIGLSEFILKYFFGMKKHTSRYKFTSIDFDEYLNDFYNPTAAQVEEAPEIQMIQNVRDFHSTKVRECMVPRNEIVAFDSEMPMQLLQKLIEETQHSKIPVYTETVDNITGYVHLFDLFTLPHDIQKVIRPIAIVPETTPASEVLDMMINQRKSLAVVVDEFGGTAGMVTVEDLIEEIFGEIQDEFDVDEFVEKQKSDTEFIFAGRLEIDYLNQHYNLNLPVSEEYETLAGLIINHHQSIPKRQQSIDIAIFTFTILEATDNRIDKVLLKIN